MRLENIKEKLEKEGYTLTIRPLKGIEKCLQRLISADNEDVSLNGFFRVFIFEEKLYLDFASQRRENKYFDTEKELIEHIKETFPV